MALSNLKKVGGNLFIIGNNFSEIKLDSLTEINGKLQIGYNKNLDTIDFSQVNNIGGKTQIKNNGNIINMTWNDNEEYDWDKVEEETTLGGPGSYAWTNTARDIKHAVPLTLEANITKLSDNENRITIILVFSALYWNNELLEAIDKKFNFKIDWGDGTLPTVKNDFGDTKTLEPFIGKLYIEHTYEKLGNYKIELVGTKKEEITYEDDSGKKQTFLTTGLISINVWNNELNVYNSNITKFIKFGSNIYYNWIGTYQDMTVVEGDPTDLPVTSKQFTIKDGEYNRNNYNSVSLFSDSKQNFPILEYLNTNYVENTRLMFESNNDISIFNQDISSWDVSNFTDMGYMFYGAKKFNQNISSWTVSNVITMFNMFSNTNDFNQDIDSWDVSNVTNMDNMFINSNMSALNTANLLIAWETKSKESAFKIGLKIAFNKKEADVEAANAASTNAIDYFRTVLLWEVNFDNTPNTQ